MTAHQDSNSSPPEGERALPLQSRGGGSPQTQAFPLEQRPPTKSCKQDLTPPHGGSYPAKHVTYARSMRKEMTPWEFALWRQLKEKIPDHKFRRQQPIGPYIVNFYNAQHQLIIELDGSQHAENARDQKRDLFLQRNEYRILRFWNNEIDQNIDGVLLKILDALQAPPHASHTASACAPPLPLEGGVKEVV